MTVLATVTAAVRAYRHRRELARTEMLIAALPSEVRKDIGWPEPARTRLRRSPVEAGC